MKRSVSFSYNMDVNVRATGLPAVISKIRSSFEKFKAMISGEKLTAESAIGGCGQMNIEVNTSIEFTPEEARMSADILQEQYDKLPQNMEQFISASRQLGEHLREEIKTDVVVGKEVYNLLKPTAEEKAAKEADDKEEADRDIRCRIRRDLSNRYTFNTEKYSAAEKKIAKELWKELYSEEMSKEKAEELFPKKKASTSEE